MRPNVRLSTKAALEVVGACGASLVATIETFELILGLTLGHEFDTGGARGARRNSRDLRSAANE